jgi:hypothetical protein
MAACIGCISKRFPKAAKSRCGAPRMPGKHMGTTSSVYQTHNHVYHMISSDNGRSRLKAECICLL